MKTKKEFKALQAKCRKLAKKRDKLISQVANTRFELEECHARITMKNYHTWYLDGELVAGYKERKPPD